ELIDLLDVGLEGVAHDEEIVALTGNRIPINYIGSLFLAERSHSLGATTGPGVGRRCAHRVLLADEVVPFADSFRRLEAEKEPALRGDVVILQVETLQPGMIPGEIFGLDESLEEPFLANPIHATEERLGFVWQGVEGVTPAVEQPVRFLITAAEITTGQVLESPLDIESGDRVAVFEFNHPTAG